MIEKGWATAACRGDEDAFYQLISLHRRKLYGIAYSYLRNEADALEVVQETVCRAWSKCTQLKDPDSFMPWLIRILINCSIDEQKRRRRITPEVSMDTTTGTAEMISVERMDLEMALEQMKPKYRHVLMLKYYQDMTLTDIAKVLDRPEGTIKTWLHQGLKQIRKQMDWGGERYHG